MNRDHNKKMRASYISEKAKMRQMHEESRMQEVNQSLDRIQARQFYVKSNMDASQAKSTMADVDSTSEAEKNEKRAQKGLKILNEMNIDLEDIIKHFYKKLQSENEPQGAAAMDCLTPVSIKE